MLAIAVESRSAPLLLASRNLALSRLSGRVLLVRGSGLAPVRRADVIVIAGVGGDLAAQLLDAGGAGGGFANRVVVQPNRHSREVRSWARGAGFHVVEERAVAEGGQLHLVLSFERRGGDDPAYGARPDQAELLLGPLLLARGAAADPASRLFLRRELPRLRALSERRPDLACAAAVLEELFGG